MPEKQNFIKKQILEYKSRKRVRLSRSLGGTIMIFIFLAVVGAFMILPILYSIVQSLKPINEIFAYPPKFFVRNPTFDNFRQVLRLTDNLYVPFIF